MTVRDLIGPAEPVGGQAAAIGLRRLAHVVDHAIWSGAAPDPRLHIESWAAVAELRRALRSRSSANASAPPSTSAASSANAEPRPSLTRAERSRGT